MSAFQRIGRQDLLMFIMLSMKTTAIFKSTQTKDNPLPARRHFLKVDSSLVLQTRLSPVTQNSVLVNYFDGSIIMIHKLYTNSN